MFANALVVCRLLAVPTEGSNSLAAPSAASWSTQPFPLAERKLIKRLDFTDCAASLTPLHDIPQLFVSFLVSQCPSLLILRVYKSCGRGRGGWISTPRGFVNKF